MTCLTTPSIFLIGCSVRLSAEESDGNVSHGVQVKSLAPRTTSVRLKTRDSSSSTNTHLWLSRWLSLLQVTPCGHAVGGSPWHCAKRATRTAEKAHPTASRAQDASCDGADADDASLRSPPPGCTMAALPALGTLAFAPGAAASVPPLDLSLDEIIKMNKKQGKKQGAKVRVAQAHNAQRWAASLESRLAQSAFCVHEERVHR